MRKVLVFAISFLCATTVHAQTNTQTAIAEEPSAKTCLLGALTERGSNQLFMCDKTGTLAPVEASVTVTSGASASEVEAALGRATDAFTGAFRRR